MKRISFRFGTMGLSANYDVEYPKWFSLLFREMAQIYFYSATKRPSISLQNVSAEMVNLLRGYLEANELKYDLRVTLPIVKDANYETAKLDPNKFTVMLTGGKDSLHALMVLLEKHKKKNIQCLYVPNINKSESYHEKIAVTEVCKKAGVRFRIIDASNSIQLNRSGHNIALRSQLLVTLALPYILDFGSHNVTFGLEHLDYPDPGLYTCSKESFDFFKNALNNTYNIKLNIVDHPMAPIKEFDIIKQMIEKWPEYLDLSSSCYRQLNFREKQNSLLRERHPDFKCYQGCGNCVKCLRINGVKALYDSSGHFASRWNMAKEVNNIFVTKFSDDKELGNIVKELRTNVLERKHLDVGTNTNISNSNP